MTTPAPEDDSITLEQLDRDPYPIYRRLRKESPVLRVKAIGRTMLTKAADTRYVKDNPEIFSSNDPNTPMRRAFQAHTLMRKDGVDHRRERMAMAPVFNPKVIQNEWVPRYREIAKHYISQLPRGEVVDLFPALAGPYAARGLAILMGMEAATDEQMQRWSQDLIDGAGNFGWHESIFERVERSNIEMNALLDSLQPVHKATPDSSALSVMLNAAEPIEQSQIYSNIKIAIGGGINEPRDSLNTIIYGLLTNPEQLQQVVQNDDWELAFEEGVRWVAPIQVSSRLVIEDIEIRGCTIAKGDTVMTIQASANRDEDLYDNGESFNVYRGEKGHQAFGNGPHFCLGARVARPAIGELMLPMLFDRFPNMKLPSESDVIWRGFGFRGPIQLPVMLK